MKNLPKIRVGQGFDVHALQAGDHIILCGVKIPFTAAFLAHSDGDVALHALCDAIYGALAAGDIGQHFPDTAACNKNRDSSDFLQHALKLMQQKGFGLINADLTIIAQKPKMQPHIPAMRQKLSDWIDCDLEQINIKATTTEKLGFAGREEGIAVMAIVLLGENQ